MPVRMARGLFRMWLVLSAIWIAAVAISMWPSKPPFNPSKPFEVVPSNSALGNRASPNAEGQGKQILSDAEFQALHESPRATKPQSDPSEFAAFILGENAKTTAEVALVPPLLLLLIGSAMGWVVRGFRN